MSATTSHTMNLQSGLITRWLRALYPQHAAKRIATDADVDVRTAEAWLAGASLPRTLQFVRLAAQHETLLVEIAMLREGGE